MEACLEALLEMDFCSKPPNFGVEAHMEAPAGDALSVLPFRSPGRWDRTSKMAILPFESL
jgi:hypothetical protein